MKVLTVLGLLLTLTPLCRAERPFVPQVDNLILSPPFTFYFDKILHDGKPKSAHFQPIPAQHSTVEFSDDGRNILLITR